MNESDFGLVEGNGNTFRDFGDPLADLRQATAIIAARIIGVLDERELTVGGVADATGFAAVDFSRIQNASLGRFTRDPTDEDPRRTRRPHPGNRPRRSAEAGSIWCAVLRLTSAA